jgi:hypothetical protein
VCRADGIDELIGKLLTGKVNDAGGFLIVDYEVADCLEQVCLAQSASSVHEKGIVGLRGRLGHRDGGSMTELVVRADDEGLEGVPWIHPGRCLVLSALRGNCPGERGLRVGKRRQKRFSGLSRAGSDELDIPGTAEHLRNGFLDEPKIVAINQELMNRIQNSKDKFQPSSEMTSTP